MLTQELRKTLIVIIDEFVKFSNEIEERIRSDSWKRIELTGERRKKFMWALSNVAAAYASAQIDLDALVADPDVRILLFTLCAFSVGVSVPRRYSEEEMRKVLVIGQTHPMRSVREAARLYLFEVKALRPTQQIQSAWASTESRESSMIGFPDNHKAWVTHQLLTQVLATLSRDPWYDGESLLFRGTTNRWMLQSGYPLMAALFRGGELSLADLVCVELNVPALTQDLQKLIDTGDVQREEEFQGIFSKPKALYSLANPSNWSGPPF